MLVPLFFLPGSSAAPLGIHRAVTDSINQLITMCTQQAPGQKECDNALRELEVRLKGETTRLSCLLLVCETSDVLVCCCVSAVCEGDAGEPN